MQTLKHNKIFLPTRELKNIKWINKTNIPKSVEKQ